MRGSDCGPHLPGLKVRNSMQPVCFPMAGLLLVLGGPDLES